ncbi:MAG: Gfo/Idh/MocA family oxidoreductase [Balneolales bacterium]|nr:Gfo/Idh/MocA family oxidoreductase [Balneolales bacterium]
MTNMNRRAFIEMISGLAGTTFLAAQMPWFTVFTNPSGAGMSASDRVRVGFIGVGSRGQTLMLNVQEFQARMNIDIVAVCDTWPEHKERAVAMTNGQAEGFLDYREMLDKVQMDAVIIATPLHEHAQMTIDAMQMGIHVFVEKAMARTLDDTKAMYDAHIDSGKIMLVGHQRLFSPVYIKALEMINNGELGKITKLRGWWTRNTPWIFYDVPGGRGSALDRQRNWRLYWDYSAGQITELGSHHFQLANWVLDSEPLSVMGSGSLNYHTDGREVYDNYSLVFTYPNGVHFTYDLLDSNRHNGVGFQVLGNEGTMQLEANRHFAETPPRPPAIRTLIHNIEKSIFETIPIGGATWIPAEAVKYGGNYISPDYQLNETLLFLEGFIEFVRKGEAPPKLTEEGYNASTWSLLADEASREGTILTLPEKYKIKPRQA